ncbi:hypothetical protein NR415_002344 [Salmonella enterica]|nr:hypothetical protein [Salmonella enterica]
MAFVSVREFAIKALGRDAEQPNVVFRISKSGSANGRFNKSCPFGGHRVDFQIDEHSKKIRVRADDSGLSVHKGTGQFSASKEVFKILGPQKIFITESDDGWWYGSYD